MSSSSTNDVVLELLRQRAVLGRKLNAFVPVVGLPPEVLTTIFKLACCSIEDKVFEANIEKPSSVDDPDNALAGTPLLIARVCSVWRNVALSTSQLWTNVIIYYEDERDENQATMLKYWLSKSGEHPLDVQIMQQGSFMETEYTEVIDVVKEYRHRLRTLNLFLPTAWESAVIGIADCVPLLTQLTLRWPDYDNDPMIERVDMFANASQLCEVALVGYSAADVSLPRAQLQSLESRYNSVVKCVETLPLYPRLRRCLIDLAVMSRTETQSAPVTHTMIEELEVSSHDEEPVPELLNALELPALRSFELRLCVHWLFEWKSWLSSFLARASGTLEALILPYASPLEEELLVALQVVPKLKKLVLRNGHWHSTEKKLTQRALDLLNANEYEGLRCEEAGQVEDQGGEDGAGTQGPDESSNSSKCFLLPSLETFEYEGGIDFTPHALVKFLLARWTGPFACSELGERMRRITGEPAAPRPSALPMTRLHSAIFKTPTRIRFEDADRAVIKRLRQEGMRLEFWTLQKGTDVLGCQGHSPL